MGHCIPENLTVIIAKKTISKKKKDAIKKTDK
jgi:hypothetical protein